MAVLEDDHLGPLTLVSRGDNREPSFVEETYKAALRAYVSQVPPQRDRATKIMAELEALAEQSGDAEAAARVTKIYLGLGMQLAAQIKRLREANLHQAADRVTAALAEFLDRVAVRQDAANWQTGNWLAQMYARLGGEYARADATGAEISSYFVKAVDAYREILQRAEEEPTFAPSDIALLAVRMRLAECLREIGRFKEAITLFANILREKPSMLDVQRSAAQTYQRWGQAGNESRFENAIFGGEPDKQTGKNLIWGWLKLADVANSASRRLPKYKGHFFEARYEAARTRFLAAQQVQGASRRQQLQKAAASVKSMARLYPALGGPDWKKRFDALLKQIEQAQQVGA